ncbi:hypothetical protein [Paenibacillus sp. PSB04]|uniref:hypothetical protein n=1 Tax=Paenibacillus sp. PSB04 TaxID=2866810 RepID=UPI0021F1CC33|nr:hypothetical protein [Paenibacillus sp. PSB04]UYO05982.1 hypothetical protein K2F33_08845 [Paenibacillus sp. PSB04]
MNQSCFEDRIYCMGCGKLVKEHRARQVLKTGYYMHTHRLAAGCDECGAHYVNLLPDETGSRAASYHPF